MLPQDALGFTCSLQLNGDPGVAFARLPCARVTKAARHPEHWTATGFDGRTNSTPPGPPECGTLAWLCELRL